VSPGQQALIRTQIWPNIRLLASHNQPAHQHCASVTGKTLAGPAQRTAKGRTQAPNA